VACMKGFAEALEFMLDRERHLVASMSNAQLLRLVLDDISVAGTRMRGVWSLPDMLVIQPLAVASYRGHVSCVECLLRHGW